MAASVDTLTPNQVQALKLLCQATKGSCLFYELGGYHNSGVRQTIMSALYNKKTPKAKCGINAMQEAFFSLSGIEDYTCHADHEDKFKAWVESIIEQA